MNLELWQILGNQAFDDAFYAEMNDRLNADNMLNAFVENEISKYYRTGILPIYISHYHDAITGRRNSDAYIDRRELLSGEWLKLPYTNKHGKNVNMKTDNKTLGGKWDKMDGGVKPVFSHVNYREIIAACDKFSAEHEPNHAANKARRNTITFGRKDRKNGV